MKFSGPDVDLLLANRAELLLALEHLTMEILRMPSEDDHTRFASMPTIIACCASRSSAPARWPPPSASSTPHAPFRFNPMNSRERRVLHLALRDETAVRSESEGLEPRRNVVIYPAGHAIVAADFAATVRSARHRGGHSDRGRPGGGDRGGRSGGRPGRGR